MNRTSGFTLIELLIAVAALGILIGLGIPRLAGYRDALARQEARGLLIADLRQARQIAATRHHSVIVAFGDGSVTTNITRYSLHTDLDGDRVRDANEPRVERVLPNRIRLESVQLSPVDSLIFDIGGLLVPGSSGGRLVLAGPHGRPDTLAISAVGTAYRP